MKLGKSSIDKSVVEPVVKFKLHSQPRQIFRIMSDDDIFVCDVNVPWMEVMKAIDAPIVRFCTSNDIKTYILYKTSAITVSIPSRAPTDTGSTVLERAESERWEQFVDLVRLNHSIGMKSYTTRA
jgi:hypothetical protein